VINGLSVPMTFTQELTERNNQLKKKNIKRIAKDKLQDWAAKKGIKPKSNLFMLEKLEKELKIVAPKEGEHGCTVKARMINATKILHGKKPRSYGGSPKEADNKKVAKFYRSYQWRAVRYDILEVNDGRCECCGQKTLCSIISRLRER